MPVESPEDRTVEVLALPAGVDEELLFLYFENKRRSGGGPLVSVDKKGDHAILLFEEAEVAAQVLSKGHHVLHNVELSVRRPASKDRCRLLLRGTNPGTSTEMIELYVENMMGLNVPDYSLQPSPERQLVLIQLSQPLSKDFQSISAKISTRKLDGAAVTLEQIEETDSILVQNLHPGTTQDVLTSYFENKGGGDRKVKEVTMLSEGTAKVSFVSYESVGPVLAQTHKLEDADLAVMPYFDFLQPTQSPPLQDTASGVQATTESESEDQSDNYMQTGPPAAEADSQPSPLTALEPLAVDTVVQPAHKVMEVEMEEEGYALYSHIAVANPVKLALFQLSTLKQDTEKTYPNCTIAIKDDGVHVTGADRQTSEQVKHVIADFFGKMFETHLTLEPDEAQFLERADVKERLLHTMTQTGSPSMYTVSDCDVVVTSVSHNWANQACSFLKTQLCHFSIPMDNEYECMFYCREWSEFLQALGFTSVKVPERGGDIHVLTLKGMESEKQAAILTFLTTPIERETVISMEPGQLTYIQNHCHQLLADMAQVSIFPLEAEDVCGLKIQGLAIACQMAEEVLQGVVSSICTRTITVNAPGVTRFFCDKECVSILKQMETKFSVYISTKHVPWEYLAHQDIFQTAWTMLSERNFPRVTLDGSPQELKSDPMQTDDNGAADTGLLAKAKRIVSAIDESDQDSDHLDDMDNLDLYTADEPTGLTDQGCDVLVADSSQPSDEGGATSVTQMQNDGAVGLSSELEEDAQLSLAIQYSMETSHWSLEDEEEQLQKALELSKSMIQHESSSTGTVTSPTVGKGAKVSLQDTIKAANTLQLVVFAGYSCDLIRVDIAFGKKVTQRQVEEKLEHRCLRNLSEYNKRCLELVKRKHGVEIQIQGSIITVSGFKDFVNGAICDVKLMLEKMPNAVSDREILRTIKWSHHDPLSKDVTPYCPDATVFLENIWRLKLTSIDILLDNQLHVINFEKMQELNKASRKSVKISRKLIALEDLNEDVPEEEYSLLSNMPEVTRVDEESDEFQNVVKNFYETIQEYHSKIRIIKVEKLMNRLLYNQYKLKKASVIQRATYPEIERTLYHGTSDTVVKEICVHGFNRSFCGKNATVYGQGVYFAVNSSLSVQEQYSPSNADGHKFVFVSRVLTGDYTKGCHSMKTAPLKDSGDTPLRYDSVTDDITKPTMFVIFNDTQAFPEYLITCQRIHR